MHSSRSHSKAGYYEVFISSASTVALLKSNNERAFIVTQLQDLLGTRSVLEEPDAYRRLASHIDLLAFSLLPDTIRFVLFSISAQSVSVLTELLLSRLDLFRSDQQLGVFAKTNQSTEPVVRVRPLIGPHEALATSIEIHLDHSDWEYDRYSSIGFYLHDRRGDWMRLWRLSHLYENTPTNYRLLLSTRH